MDLMVEMRFGSHLYGTSTPDSDLDLKGVYVPEGRDILLGRVRASLTEGPAKAGDARTLVGDVDREVYSLQRYLGLLAEGQTLALDMLFAPDAAMTRAPGAVWGEIRANSGRLVTRRATASLRYCRQQANKYGLKGGRLAAARRALEALVAAEGRHGGAAKLAVTERALVEEGGTAGLAFIVDVPAASGAPVRHFEVCGKRMPFSGSIKTGREMMQRLVDEYGQRALEAERNEGVDWKSLSHAVRVGREMVELMETGRITLPLPYAGEVLAIRRGERGYAAVAEEIEGLMGELEVAAAGSALPEEVDWGFVDGLVERVYRGKVLGGEMGPELRPGSGCDRGARRLA